MIKLMILIVLLACVGPFFIKGPDGEPLLSFEDFLPDISAESATAAARDVLPSEPTRVFKWQDENGVWQFSTNPADEAGSEVMELDGNINTVEAFVAPGKVSKVETRMPSLPAGFTSVSSEQMENMMETVNGLQETIDKRQEAVKKAAGGN